MSHQITTPDSINHEGMLYMKGSWNQQALTAVPTRSFFSFYFKHLEEKRDQGLDPNTEIPEDEGNI